MAAHLFEKLREGMQALHPHQTPTRISLGGRIQIGAAKLKVTFSQLSRLPGVCDRFLKNRQHRSVATATRLKDKLKENQLFRREPAVQMQLNNI